jgi:hypothetical protein
MLRLLALELDSVKGPVLSESQSLKTCCRGGPACWYSSSSLNECLLVLCMRGCRSARFVKRVQVNDASEEYRIRSGALYAGDTSVLEVPYPLGGS